MYNIRMKFSDYMKYSFYLHIVGICLFLIILGLGLLTSGFIVTKIKITTSDNNVDAHVIRKLFFIPLTNRVIKNVKQLQTGTEASSYNEIYRIVLEDVEGNEYFVEPLSFFETSDSDIILIKQLDTTIKQRTNNTFTIQHKNHVIWGLSFIIISSLLFFIFLKDDKNSKAKKTESKQKIKKTNNPLPISNENKEKSKYKNINNSIIKK